MDSRSLEDVIHKRNPPSLTEDDVIDFPRHSDPYHDGWDDGVIRMRFRISSYLRSVLSLPEPDLSVLDLFLVLSTFSALTGFMDIGCETCNCFAHDVI